MTSIVSLVADIVALIADEIRHAEREGAIETLERIRAELHRAKSHREQTAEALAAAEARLREDVP